MPEVDPDEMTVLAVAHEPMLLLGADHRIVALNPAAARLLGEAADAALGRPLLEWAHPDDREALAAGWTATGAAVVELAARLRGGDQDRGVTLRCARDGGGRLVIAAREPGSVEALRAGRDLARQQLAAVFATTLDVMLVTDERGVITDINRPPAGLRHADLIGVPMLSFAAPEERVPMRERYDRVFTSGALEAYDTEALFPGGRIERFVSRLGAIRDGERSVGTVLVTRNVTEERRIEAAKRSAEAQLREYMLQLERSNAELERFASVASHDLQEPLRKIQAFSDRLRDRFREELPDAGRDYLERIRGAARRMQDLINDLLMFSRLSTVARTFAPVDLARVVRSVMSDLELRIEETGGRIDVSGLPAIEADALSMRQLFQNMIGNALKFTRPDAAPVVKISAEVAPAPDGRGPGELRIEIADNGIGIEPRHHDRIFGFFERLHGRGKYEGTGVGLAVCRKIVEQHHGSIRVASVVDQGTTFTITLPLKQTPA